MDKQNIVYTHNETVFSYKKKLSANTWYDTDEPWEHYAEWNQSDAKGPILYDSTCIYYLE